MSWSCCVVCGDCQNIDGSLWKASWGSSLWTEGYGRSGEANSVREYARIFAARVASLPQRGTRLSDVSLVACRLSLHVGEAVGAKRYLYPYVRFANPEKLWQTRFVEVSEPTDFQKFVGSVLGNSGNRILTNTRCRLGARPQWPHAFCFIRQAVRLSWVA